MADSDFLKQLTQANRVLLRAMRRHEAACRAVVGRGLEFGDAKCNLRLLLQAPEPYVPPTADETRDAQRRAEERE